MANFAFQVTNGSFQGNGQFAYQGSSGEIVTPTVIGGYGRTKRKRQERRGRHLLPDGKIMFGTFTEYAQRILELYPEPVVEATREPDQAPVVETVGEHPFEVKALAQSIAKLENAVKAPNLDLEEQNLRWLALQRLIEIQEEETIAVLLLH